MLPTQKGNRFYSFYSILSPSIASILIALWCPSHKLFGNPILWQFLYVWLLSQLFCPEGFLDCMTHVLPLAVSSIFSVFCFICHALFPYVTILLRIILYILVVCCLLILIPATFRSTQLPLYSAALYFWSILSISILLYIFLTLLVIDISP